MDTATYILKQVAPIFNKRGYIGATLSELTAVTGMTKGALYGNFLSKEDLAVKAFSYNLKIAIYPMFDLVAQQSDALDKLQAVTDYHRGHYERVEGMGGCPMLRVSSDTQHTNPLLFRKAQRISQIFLSGLIDILDEGKQSGLLKSGLDSANYAKVILSMIEGATSLAFTHKDRSFLPIAMDATDKLIEDQMKV
ncbi:MAG: TetR/AcrR family transcriptional regulator [Bacteroidota bacterium]